MLRRLFHIALTAIPRRFHRIGFGVQSPWAYELANDVFFEKIPYYAFDTFACVRKRIKNGNGMLSRMHDEQLFRIANYLKPKSIAEVGPGNGISRQYLKSPHPQTPFFTFEADGNEISRLKSIYTKEHPIGLLHISHTDKAEEIYEWAVNNTDNDSVIILEHINRKPSLWRKIVADQRAIITFDFITWGMIVFDRKRIKQNYLL